MTAVRLGSCKNRWSRESKSSLSDGSAGNRKSTNLAGQVDSTLTALSSAAAPTGHSILVRSKCIASVQLQPCYECHITAFGGILADSLRKRNHSVRVGVEASKEIIRLGVRQGNPMIPKVPLEVSTCWILKNAPARAATQL